MEVKKPEAKKMEEKRQIPPLDQNKAQKLANELMTSQPNELDDFEKESMQERAQFSQQMSNIDTQLKQLEERRESLKTDRSRIEGASDYVWQKLLVYRHKKQHETQEVSPKGDSKSDGKPGVGDQLEGTAETQAKDEAGEGGAKASEVKSPTIPMPKSKKNTEAQPSA